MTCSLRVPEHTELLQGVGAHQKAGRQWAYHYSNNPWSKGPDNAERLVESHLPLTRLAQSRLEGATGPHE